jgi:hypothetical protein
VGDDHEGIMDGCCVENLPVQKKISLSGKKWKVELVQSPDSSRNSVASSSSLSRRMADKNTDGESVVTKVESVVGDESIMEEKDEGKLNEEKKSLELPRVNLEKNETLLDEERNV